MCRCSLPPHRASSVVVSGLLGAGEKGPLGASGVERCGARAYVSRLPPYFFSGGWPALPFRNLPRSGGFPGSCEESPPRPGVSPSLGRRGAQSEGQGALPWGAQGAGPRRVGRERGSRGRSTAWGHSPAPEGAQSSHSRDSSSSGGRTKEAARVMLGAPPPPPLALPVGRPPHVLARNSGVTQPPKPRGEKEKFYPFPPQTCSGEEVEKK